jgi:hypothetical protein
MGVKPGSVTRGEPGREKSRSMAEPTTLAVNAAVNVVGGQVGEIISASGVIHWHAVDQHQVEVGITPTWKDARDPTPTPGLCHAQAWQRVRSNWNTSVT